MQFVLRNIVSSLFFFFFPLDKAGNALVDAAVDAEDAAADGDDDDDHSSSSSG